MSGKFQPYVAFVDGIPIGIGTLTAISQCCNVRRREIKMLVPQKWRHGGRPRRKPKSADQEVRTRYRNPQAHRLEHRRNGAWQKWQN